MDANMRETPAEAGLEESAGAGIESLTGRAEHFMHDRRHFAGG
jgi:hypothetical protein